MDTDIRFELRALYYFCTFYTAKINCGRIAADCLRKFTKENNKYNAYDANEIALYAAGNNMYYNIRSINQVSCIFSCTLSNVEDIFENFDDCVKYCGLDVTSIGKNAALNVWIKILSMNKVIKDKILLCTKQCENFTNIDNDDKMMILKRLVNFQGNDVLPLVQTFHWYNTYQLLMINYVGHQTNLIDQFYEKLTKSSLDDKFKHLFLPTKIYGNILEEFLTIRSLVYIACSYCHLPEDDDFIDQLLKVQESCIKF